MWTRFASLVLLTVAGGCATVNDAPPKKPTAKSTQETEAEMRAHQAMSQPPPNPGPISTYSPAPATTSSGARGGR
ncbi:MAG TPA: hypothetical protein VGH63_13290 [Polyangia bacterium]|jgi:hypothetical protein